VLPVSVAFARVHKRRVLTVLDAADEPERELKILGIALARLERKRFQSPRLSSLRSALDTAGGSASGEIHRLVRLIGLADARRNQFFRFFAYFMMWATQLAYAIERWRAKNGPGVPKWLVAVGEFEALMLHFESSPCRGMVAGMATTKVTITLADDQLDEIRALVSQGRAPNVSAFVKHAVGVALHDAAGWREMLKDALLQTGGPLTKKERAWADAILSPRRRKARSRPKKVA